nr:MAG TPA: hypothetical protein [Caudoviricetes sp.]
MLFLISVRNSYCSYTLTRKSHRNLMHKNAS